MNMESKETQAKIHELQLIEQSMQNFLMQKQSFQSQLMEIESALSEIEKTENAYKIVGNIMVASSREDLKNDLQKKKDIAELRIKSVEKQEASIKQKATKMQEEVLKEMKSK